MQHFAALATDYDGTLARDGSVAPPTVDALERFRKAGRALILITGRELGALIEAFPRLDLFDRVVAENGALLYRPADRSETLLAEPPSKAFVDALIRRGVGPISAGRVIVATWEPHHPAVLDAIRETGLEMQVILNKRAIMILPSGVDKASGLAAAVSELRLDPHAVAGVGDAENDMAFLSICGLSVAVANALPAVKEGADLVTAADHGAGVAELIDCHLLREGLRT